MPHAATGDTPAPGSLEKTYEHDEEALEVMEMPALLEEPASEASGRNRRERGRELVVTATRTEQAVATAPASVSVITGEDLKQAPVGDLTDALRDLPGISISAGSQGRRQIQIRGMSSAFTLLLIDGKRVNSSEAVFRHNDFDIGQLPIENIERIEVVRGGMSALYGSEALGGVINIITKPVSSVWTAGVDTEVQTPSVGINGSEARASLRVSGPLVEDHLGVSISGNFNHREPWKAWPDELVRNDKNVIVTRPDGSQVNRSELATLEGRNDHSVRARMTWTPTEKQKVDAEYAYGYQTRIGEYFINNRWGDADMELNRHDASLAHRADLGWGNSELRAYAEWIDTGADGLTQTNQIAEGNLTSVLGDHTLTFGTEVRWTQLRSAEEFAGGGAHVNRQAVYLQDDVQITDQLSLLLGARLDHHKHFGLHLTPRGYIVYSLTDSLVVKGGVGTAFKAPTLRQMSEDSRTSSCRGACLIVGNNDLKPETSTNYELSLNYDTKAVGGSLTGFWNNIDNLIDTPRGAGVPPIGTDPQTQLPIFVPVNINSARIRGIEATAYSNILQFGRITANYTLLDAVDLDADELLPYRPRHNINARADWYASDSITVFLRGQLIGRQAVGTEELGAYALFDVGATWAATNNLDVRAGVLNLADRRTDNPNDEYPYVERGRTVYAGLSARL